MKAFIFAISSLLLAVVTFAEPNSTNDSFATSKKLLLKVYLDAQQGDFYCGATFDKSGNITNLNGYTPKRDTAKARRIEWDHVVPAEAFGQSFTEWRDGDPACVDKKGKAFKGRNCAEKLNPLYRFMQADMYNLRPAIGEVNNLKSNYSMAMIGGETYEFGACQLRMADRKFEPPAHVRGDVARIYLYMNAAYPGRGIISDKNEKLFAAWNASDPVDTFECALYQKIKALQGNENEILRDACAGNVPPATDTPAPQPTVTPIPTATTKPAKAAPSEAAEYSCSPKKTCKEMDSCEEAYFRLEKCGQKQLDRDKDGIPCEALCGK